MTASMAATAKPALHPVPEQGAIVREQISAVSIAIRKEQYFFIGTLAALVVLGIYAAVRFVGSGHNHANLDVIDPRGAVPMSLVALLIPFGVWRASDRERRAYDWTMPIAQSTHTIIRLLAGWAWVMIGVVIYLVVLIALGGAMVEISGGHAYWPNVTWQVLVPFTSATIAYLLTSIAIIGSDHPWRWVGGIVIGYLVALLVLEMVQLHALQATLQEVFIGKYGLSTAIFGNTTPQPPSHGDPLYYSNSSRWLGATALWGVLSIIGVWLAARRHSTS